MYNCLITLRSATYSMKAQKILTDAAIPSKTVKLDSEYSGKGCTHGIRIDCRYKRSAERLLRENGIAFSDIIKT